MATRAPIQARRNVVQALYQYHLAPKDVTDILAEFKRNEECLQNAGWDLFAALVSGVVERQSELNDRLQAHLDRPLSELDPVELAILHLGCYELEYRTEVPWKVVVNEAIELAKLFGAEQSYKYINGILAKLAQDRHPSVITSSGGDDDRSEAALIDRYFKPAKTSSGVVLGIGDDAAIIDVPADAQLALTMDTLVQGVHFSPDTAAADIGYKAVAVNLSDLAAIGAAPQGLSLSLTMPDIDHAWLRQFADGLHELIREFSLDLIGGDTCRGPLAITVQAYGLLPKGQRPPTRNNAGAGDRVYVTGCLGAAGMALKLRLKQLSAAGDYAFEQRCLNRPRPRVEAGLIVREYATSMIDISDGLVADLGDILRQSGVGARIDLDSLPITANMRGLEPETAWSIALSAGDDYELCFTLPDRDHSELLKQIEAHCAVTRIGCITDGNKLTLLQADGGEFAPDGCGYQHFKG